MIAFYLGSFPLLFLFGLGFTQFKSIFRSRVPKILGYVLVVFAFVLVTQRYIPKKISESQIDKCHTNSKVDKSFHP